MSIFIPVDLTNYYIPTSLQIDDVVTDRSTAQFKMVDKTGVLDLQDGIPVEIYDWSGNLTFGGFINYPKRMNPIGTNALFYDVECVDNNCIADRYLVVASYTNQIAGYVVNNILQNYLIADGVTTGTIQDGLILDIAKFPRTNTVTEVFDQLAEICGFIWYIDYDKKLYFVERSASVAPFAITDVSAILNINLRQDRSRYRNRQFLRGGKTPTDEPILAEFPSPKPDGVTRTFTTRYPLASSPTIYINSVQVATNQIGINGIDGKITPLQWYWSYESNTITQDSTQVVLSITDVIEIDYIGLIPLIVVVEDSDAINARSLIENVSGVYESLETMPNINDKEQALNIANGKLLKYTKVERELTYQTFTNGLFAGQLQTINLTKYNVTSGEFLIDKITISDLDNNGHFIYDVHAVDGQPFGGWTNFFKGLIRKETGIVIDSDEKLIVLKSINEKDYWSEATIQTIFVCVVPNVTVYPSLTFYPC